MPFTSNQHHIPAYTPALRCAISSFQTQTVHLRCLPFANKIQEANVTEIVGSWIRSQQQREVTYSASRSSQRERNVVRQGAALRAQCGSQYASVQDPPPWYLVSSARPSVRMLTRVHEPPDPRCTWHPRSNIEVTLLLIPCRTIDQRPHTHIR